MRYSACEMYRDEKSKWGEEGGNATEKYEINVKDVYNICTFLCAANAHAVRIQATPENSCHCFIPSCYSLIVALFPRNRQRSQKEKKTWLQKHV